MEADWARLKAAYENRQRKLQDANRSAQFYADANDAEEFISENQTVVNSFDAGRDEEAAVNMLKKQAAVQGDIDSFEFSIKALRALAQTLVDGDHFDKAEIAARRVRTPPPLPHERSPAACAPRRRARPHAS